MKAARPSVGKESHRLQAGLEGGSCYQLIKGQGEDKDRGTGSRGEGGAAGRHPSVPLGRKSSWPLRTTGDEASGIWGVRFSEAIADPKL